MSILQVPHGTAKPTRLTPLPTTNRWRRAPPPPRPGVNRVRLDSPTPMLIERFREKKRRRLDARQLGSDVLQTPTATGRIDRHRPVGRVYNPVAASTRTPETFEASLAKISLGVRPGGRVDSASTDGLSRSIANLVHWMQSTKSGARFTALRVDAAIGLQSVRPTVGTNRRTVYATRRRASRRMTMPVLPRPTHPKHRNHDRSHDGHTGPPHLQRLQRHVSCNWAYEVWVTHKCLFDDNPTPEDNIGWHATTVRLSTITQE